MGSFVLKFDSLRAICPPRVFSSKNSIMSEKRVNASAERNKGPILEVVKSSLPLNKSLQALEVASGTGTHVAYFAQYLPQVSWQPSDKDSRNMASLRAYMEEEGLVNVREPLVL